MHIHHIAIVVKNAENSARFYSEGLGLLPIKRLTEGQSSNGGHWFQMGNTELHLQERPSDPAKTDQHFALVVEKIDSIISKIANIGGRVSDAKPLAGFSKRTFIYDPDNNRIELLEK